MGIVIMYDIFFFALKKIFGPIEIVFHYKLHRKESTSKQTIRTCTLAKH